MMDLTIGGLRQTVLHAAKVIEDFHRDEGQVVSGDDLGIAHNNIEIVKVLALIQIAQESNEIKNALNQICAELQQAAA